MKFIKTSDGREILLPSNDFVFKLIFGSERNKDFLAAFLSAVLGTRCLTKNVTEKRRCLK